MTVQLHSKWLPAIFLMASALTLHAGIIDTFEFTQTGFNSHNPRLPG